MQAIVVTGASTGIGRASALALAEAGYRVFAGVRKPADGEALLQATTATTLTPIALDVTDASSIAAAVDLIRQAVGNAGLFGLFNNAGIVVAGPLEFVGLEQLRWQHEVNVIGQIAVTQALLPLLRQARGRIVFTSSSNGYFSPPFVGPYSASKFALEALLDALRRELRPWGIQVASIQPGAIQTPIWEKSKAAGDKTIEALPDAGKELYAGAIQRMKELTDSRSGAAAPVDTVVKAVLHAFRSRRAKTHYKVGLDAKGQFWLNRYFPVRLVDWIIAKVIG